MIYWAIYDADRVYICGGFDGQECLQTAEYYNPITNQWTLIQPMRNRRSGVGESFRWDEGFSFLTYLDKGVIAYRDAVYAIGGFNGTARLSTGERYNPSMNTWRPITDMFHPRSNFAIEVNIVTSSPLDYIRISPRCSMTSCLPLVDSMV